MFTKRFFFLLVILSVLLSSCGIETAKPFRKQHLFIASDCLDIKDTILFKGFEKYEQIEIHIRHYRSDSLKALLKREGVNTEIDAVILSSVYDMHQLSRAGLLQSQKEITFPSNVSLDHRSASGDYCGIGIDPYVLFSKDDSLSRVRSYRDLANKTKWCTDLEGPSDWFPFYAAIAQKISPKEKYTALDWIRHFLENKEKGISENDSTTLCSVVLTTFSHTRSNKTFTSKKFKDHRVNFANQAFGGSYFNMACYGIVKQARNYTNALSFLHYLFEDPVNKRLNFRLSMFPVLDTRDSSVPYQNIRYATYSVSPLRLTSNYDRVITILGILN